MVTLKDKDSRLKLVTSNAVRRYFDCNSKTNVPQKVHTPYIGYYPISEIKTLMGVYPFIGSLGEFFK